MKINPQIVEKLKETASQVVGSANNTVQGNNTNAKHIQDEVIKINFQDDARKASQAISPLTQNSSGELKHQFRDNSYGNKELGIA
jgi:AmiR/NasT family two-component response regulator